MKKLLFLFCLFLIFLPRVNAANGVVNNPAGTIWNTANQFACYNSSGTGLDNFFVNNPYSYNGVNFNPYYQCNSFSSGGIITFNIGQKTSVNQLYSMTVYVDNQYRNVYPQNSGTSIGLGNYNGQALNSLLNNSPTKPTLYSYSDSYNIAFEFYQPTSNSLSTGQAKVLYTIFKANTEYPYFAQQIFYTGNPGNLYFYGYHLEPLGDATSLSSYQVSQIVENATKDLANESSIITSTNTITNKINQAETQIKDQIEESANKIDDTINNTDTSGAQDSADSFFENFDTDDYGLSDIITMPLTLINSLLNTTCAQLTLNIPFVDKTLNLPCMSQIYEDYFGSFFDLYQLVTFGFVAYWVCVRIFNLVKDFKNPEHDEIEVMDL